ncbi:MAG: hypothetical protein M1820_008175 [Bogoriella megaspora]|nr:MAG: hypothetical protein M1820_008175 [Bogoriella megaspora]
MAGDTPPLLQGPTSKEKKYDRQLRLWAASGQAALEEAHVLLVNSGPGAVGVETLKNLILPGIGAFTILDSALVEEADLGVNFFLDEASLGKFRAAECCKYLQELNPDVEGNAISEPIETFITQDQPLKPFSHIVVVAPIAFDVLEKLRKDAEVAGKPVFYIHCVGFYSQFVLQLPEYFPVVDTHPDAEKMIDLRLVSPFQELQDLATWKTTDLDQLNDHDHGHVPYVLILLRYLSVWKSEHGGKTPQSYKEKTEFREQVRSGMRTNNAEGGEENFEEAVAAVLKSLNPPEPSSAVKEVFKSIDSGKHQSREHSNFWVIAQAIKHFYESHGLLPLPGTVPDMKAQSKDYIELQGVYKAKARKDVAEVMSYIGSQDASRIEEKEVEAFCKNAAFIKLVRGQSIRLVEPSQTPTFGPRARFASNALSNPDSLILLYLAFLAYDDFTASHALDNQLTTSQPPGVADFEVDSKKLAGIVGKFIDSLLNEAGKFIEDPEYSEIKESASSIAEEMCRAGGAELHNIASVTGGMVAQEAIKVITKQYIPVNNWKAFKFFDVEQVKLPATEDPNLLQQGNTTAVAAGSDNVFFGSADGVVRILSHDFKVVRSFKAHETGSINHMKQIEGTYFLVTIAEDLSNEPTLKVWALDKLDKKTGVPRCQSTITIKNGRKQFPITAFAALDDLSQLAVGFGNGAVTVVRGDLIHDRGTKQRTVFESEEPITGIAFREDSTTTLYIATTAKISTLVISGRGLGQPPRSLEESGCGVGCMTISEETSDVVIARDDAIYYYGPRGRGPVYAYECPKILISTLKDYVVLVSPPSSNAASRAASGRAFGNDRSDSSFSNSNLTILNTDLKLIAFQESLPSQVKSVFQEWGDLFILTVDGKLLRYHEKTFQQKLELLFQRNLYVYAINLAQKARLDPIQQNVIYRRYGDYLYQRGDFDTAMQQYLKAIDNTEPSQVIRKFLDTQRMHNLIDYLEELHEHHRATSDHTTLLLNCYAKLKDVEKLEEFIKAPGDPKFDLETAISMCRQGGYFDQAAYLARKHDEHGLVIDILIEDSKKYAEALAYIWRLGPHEAYPIMMKYATVLLEHCPKDTTQLFIDYYKGNFQPKKDAIVIPNTVTPPSQGIASSAVQNLASLLPLPYMNPSTVQSPGTEGQKTTMSQAQVIETKTNDPPIEYEIPEPRTAFSAFVDHPDQFVVFLEACIGSDDIAEDDKRDLYTTLFEMYLHVATSKKGEEKEQWETKAKELLSTQNVPIDASNVLLLSHLENFRDGTVLVREKQGLKFDIFRSYTSANDTAGAIKALRKYGPEEPHLYPAALAYFTSNPTVLEDAGDELDAVLRKIDEDQLMAPLQVIQTLSVNGVATMGLVKKYLSATVEQERKEIDQNRKIIENYRTETDKTRTSLTELNQDAATFQATRCQACGAPLELPTVHFLCKHSFHQRCLNVSEDEQGATALEDVECPVCAPQNATVKAIRRAQDDSAERHELFLDALRRSKDGFGTISEWFGRGVMGAASAVES